MNIHEKHLSVFEFKSFERSLPATTLFNVNFVDLFVFTFVIILCSTFSLFFLYHEISDLQICSFLSIIHVCREQSLSVSLG